MKNLYLILFVFPLFSSCEKIFFEEDLASNDPYQNFDYLWNECDEKYSFFDVKNIDWDEVKTRYSAKLSPDMSQEQLFDVLGGMLQELKDDHTNLVSNFNISSFGVKYGAQDNFDWRIIEDNYLPRNYYTSGPFAHDFISNGEIGYIRFSAFTGKVNDINLNFMLNRYKNTKGIILDLRENGGGAVSDVFAILSRFVEKETLLYYSRIKTGKGHSDFSEPQPTYVSPSASLRYDKKVAVLIDRATYSSGSFTALSTKALSNMVLIGDTTGGGLGLPNGGQLPNGWTYRFSYTQALTLDKNPEYENGVPADIQVNFDWSDLTKDEIIERAILELQ